MCNTQINIKMRRKTSQKQLEKKKMQSKLFSNLWLRQIQEDKHLHTEYVSLDIALTKPRVVEV